MPLFNADGFLPAGLHDMTLQQIEAQFVLPFTTSVTRSLIYAGYLRHRSELEALGIPFDQFIDGSFATTKNNPGDIDLVCFAWESDIAKLSGTDQDVLRALTGGKATQKTYLCDAYLCRVGAESDPMFHRLRERRKYWMGEFGFDRADRPKGIVRTRIGGGITP